MSGQGSVPDVPEKFESVSLNEWVVVELYGNEDLFLCTFFLSFFSFDIFRMAFLQKILKKRRRPHVAAHVTLSTKRCVALEWSILLQVAKEILITFPCKWQILPSEFLATQGFFFTSLFFILPFFAGHF